MIVSMVRIKTAKTQKHLYCPVFTAKNNPKLVIIGNSFGFSVYIDTRQG